jgi:hypothetical protein
MPVFDMTISITWLIGSIFVLLAYLLAGIGLAIRFWMNQEKMKYNVEATAVDIADIKIAISKMANFELQLAVMAARLENVTARVGSQEQHERERYGVV